MTAAAGPLVRIGELAAIRVPRLEEAVQDLLLARADLIGDRCCAGQRLGNFLLRHTRVSILPQRGGVVGGDGVEVGDPRGRARLGLGLGGGQVEVDVGFDGLGDGVAGVAVVVEDGDAGQVGGVVGSPGPRGRRRNHGRV